MLPKVYEKLYEKTPERKLNIVITPEIEEYYPKIVKDLYLGKDNARNILSEFLDSTVEISYPKAIYVDDLPIIKYQGNLYPILGEEDGEYIKINKAFYTFSCFPLVIDFDENIITYLPICYKLNEKYASTTASHEFLHHALRDNKINEAVVHKLIEKYNE